MSTSKTGRYQPNRLALAASQLKLSEPVRLYLYGVGGVIVAGLVLAGWLTDDWSAYLMAALGVVLGVVPATEAARASVYSYAGHIHSLRQLRTAQDISDALGEAA
jgi:hypothetical protein